jgi:hypothetical protein
MGIYGWEAESWTPDMEFEHSSTVRIEGESVKLTRNSITIYYRRKCFERCTIEVLQAVERRFRLRSGRAKFFDFAFRPVTCSRDTKMTGVKVGLHILSLAATSTSTFSHDRLQYILQRILQDEVAQQSGTGGVYDGASDDGQRIRCGRGCAQRCG